MPSQIHWGSRPCFRLHAGYTSGRPRTSQPAIGTRTSRSSLLGGEVDAVAGQEVVEGQPLPEWHAVARHQVLDHAHGYWPIRMASATVPCGTRSSSGNDAWPRSSVQSCADVVGMATRPAATGALDGREVALEERLRAPWTGRRETRASPCRPAPCRTRCRSGSGTATSRHASPVSPSPRTRTAAGGPAGRRRPGPASAAACAERPGAMHWCCRGARGAAGPRWRRFAWSI